MLFIEVKHSSSLLTLIYLIHGHSLEHNLQFFGNILVFKLITLKNIQCT